MSRRLIAGIVLVVLAAGLWIFGVNWQFGAAGDPEERREFVYYPLLTDGLEEYRRVSFPEKLPVMRVLADEPFVVEGRYSLVRYWPITREYLADWAKLDEPAAGIAEIVTAAGEPVPADPVLFTFWYPRGLYAGEVDVLTGAEAEDTYEAFRAEALAYVDAEQAYQRGLAEYQEAVDRWVAEASDAEEAGEPLPPPPEQFTGEPPEPYDGYARELEEGQVVTLPVGSYRIRWRTPEGEIIPGSEKRLIAFGSTDTAVGYSVIPEDRWTQPEVSFDPAETVYLAEDQEVFLTPFEVRAFNKYTWARLLRPQTIESISRAETLWVPVLDGAYQGRDFALWDAGGAEAEARPQSGYRVYQDPGALRGYSIREFEGDGTLEPDFIAVRLPAGTPVSEVALVGEDGTIVPGSRHGVKRVSSVPSIVLYLPAVLLLAAAVALQYRKARSSPDDRPLLERLMPRRAGD